MAGWRSTLGLLQDEVQQRLEEGADVPEALRTKIGLPPRILHGGDYNPDQWLDSPDILEQDLQLLRKAGCQTVTLGVFAWAALEPAPGVFRFDWLTSIMDRLHEEGVDVILATPSGAMPAWLAQEWPDALRMNREGRRMPWSWRHHHCPTSLAYRERVALIDTELARHFGNHPAVILWHIGNEFGGECFCPLCLGVFRDWLRQRHGDLDTLNRHWCNAVWSHTVFDWQQVTSLDTSNDAQQLDWKRFVTERHGSFIAHEIAIIQQFSNRPVTTNFMGLYEGMNYARIAPLLDVIAEDEYPDYHADDLMPGQALCIAMTQDRMRGLAGKKPFLLMETTPSVTNRMNPPKLKRPGIHRLQMLQALAHGASGTLYFQWRQTRGQREKFHGAVVGHDGTGVSCAFRDVAEYGRWLASRHDIVETRVRASVALLFDQESWWAMNVSCGPCIPDAPATDPKLYLATCLDWYAPFWRRGITVDVIPPDYDLGAYALVMVPMPFVMEEYRTLQWFRYVEEGGVLATSYLAGVVDRHNTCRLGPAPGAGLHELLGIRIHDLDGLTADDRQGIRFRSSPQEQIWPVQDYATLFDVIDGEAEAFYTGEFYAGEPALNRRVVGQGEAWYMGARTDRGGIDMLASRLLRRAGIHTPLVGTLHNDATVRVREGEGRRLIFAMNFSGSERTLHVQSEAEAPVRTIHLKAYESLLDEEPIRSNPSAMEAGEFIRKGIE